MHSTGTKKDRCKGNAKKSCTIKQLVPVPRPQKGVIPSPTDPARMKCQFQCKCFGYIRAGNYPAFAKLISKYKENVTDLNLNFKEKLSGNTPLIAAAYHNRIKSFKLLLENGADATLQNNNAETVLAHASRAVTAALVGGKIKSLMLASWIGDIEQVRAFLQDTENVDHCNEDGLSPLMLAARDINRFEQMEMPAQKYQPVTVVKELLKNKADPLKTDRLIKTALHYIASNQGGNATGVASALIAEIENVDLKDCNDQSPLHLACLSSSVSVAEKLLSSGANVNLQDRRGRSPLHTACFSGDETIVRLLLENNASTVLTDKNGYLAFDLIKSDTLKMLVGEFSTHESPIAKPSRESCLPTIPAKKTRSKSDPVKYKGGVKARKKKKKISCFTVNGNVQEEKDEVDVIDPSSRGFQETGSRESLNGKSQSFSDSESQRSTSQLSTSPGNESLLKRPVKTRLEPLESASPAPHIKAGGDKFFIENKLVVVPEPERQTSPSLLGIPVQHALKKRQLLPDICRTGRASSSSNEDEVQNNLKSSIKDSFSEELYHDKQRTFLKNRAASFHNIRTSKSKQESLQFTKRKSGVAYEFLLSELKPPLEENIQKMPNSKMKQNLPIFIPLHQEKGRHEKKSNRRKTLDGGKTENGDNIKKSTFTKNSEELIQSVRSKLANVNKENDDCGTLKTFDLKKRLLKRVISDSALLEEQRIPESDLAKNEANKLMEMRQLKMSIQESQSSFQSSFQSSANMPRKLEHSLTQQATCPSEKEAAVGNIQFDAFGDVKLEDSHCRESTVSESTLVILPPDTSMKSEDMCSCPRNSDTPLEVELGSTSKRKLRLSPNLEVRRKEFLERYHELDDGSYPKKTQNIAFKRRGGFKSSVLKNGDHRLITSSIDISDDDYRSSGDEMIVTKSGKHVSKYPYTEMLVTSPQTVDIEDLLHDVTDGVINETGIFGEKIASNQNYLCKGQAHISARGVTHDEDTLKKEITHPDKLKKPGTLVLESMTGECLCSTTHDEEKPCSYSEEHNSVDKPGYSIYREPVIDRKVEPTSFSRPISATTIENSGTNTNNGEFTALADLMFSPNVINSDLQVSQRSQGSVASDGINSNISTSSEYHRLSSTVSSLDSDEVEDEDLNFQLGNLLGRGAYGHVYLGLTPQGKMVAVKQVPVGPQSDRKAAKQYASLKSEINVLKGLDHKNIVRFFGTRYVDGTVSIVMEYLPGGSIASILSRFGPLPESVVISYTRQILCGVGYLHKNGIVHRDIKGGNVMLIPSGTVKLIDFGCARRLNLSLSKTTLLKSVKGTPYWMSPEVIRGTGHDFKSDIWSVGCTVYEMANGKPPWYELSMYAAMFAIANDKNDLPEMPKGLSPDGKRFILRCLIRDPEKRPTVLELEQHTFIQRRTTLSAGKKGNLSPSLK